MNQNNRNNLKSLINRIRNSKLSRVLKRELLVVLRRGNAETRKGIAAFLDYVERHPQVRAWLKSAAVVGLLLEVIPFARLGLVPLPGFAVGAVVGYLKGTATDSQLQSAIIGGTVSWPLKPVIMLSPLVGLLLTALAAGHLEEMLQETVSVARDNVQGQGQPA